MSLNFIRIAKDIGSNFLAVFILGFDADNRDAFIFDIHSSSWGVLIPVGVKKLFGGYSTMLDDVVNDCLSTLARDPFGSF
ncbi:hypothetical protein ED208_10390 [Stagnimonas aquatica]|uniref:Uncharacterized protein n=1 Tax=Stagnimonas aquatica TaxID=2689987 RepID=A0A3N0VA98_9GAMM|nr:hypothetical protein ED208_10390 [Stagnimonas aquatica]